ncbi:hypothetical protein J2X46_001105 [Nocardioides sp. BE266]|uniref:hypothetical protein n=1 Tax=Nocardioides sp. BE266 TaxID=2817725 RepID=UPI0028602EAD|nr:hypothetical protein [Nocardioides sp. BE266]MDR7252129.1 hypothetical protein [Nocardioides sp. BE266]
MGLNHPSDLAAWHRWQQSRHRLRQLRHSVRRPSGAATEKLVLTTYDVEPRLLVALDSSSPTSHASLVEPLTHLGVPLALLTPGPPPALPGRQPLATEEVSSQLPAALRGLRAVVSLGSYLPRGEAADAWAKELRIDSFVVQHGALTPHAPPLPRDARLLTWSDADATFWRSGRADVEHEVVGSQLLWHAAGRPPTDAPDTRLTYLGQMHAAELSRRRLVLAAASFCRQHDATYRPHPSERDKLSRLTHDGYRRLGITVDGSVPLAQLGGPVVSVFSTGVLEAAAQGRDAWVDFPRPPAWLGEFWERYGMHRSGGTPTPPPPRPASEPARRIAALLTEAVS